MKKGLLAMLTWILEPVNTLAIYAIYMTTVGFVGGGFSTAFLMFVMCVTPAHFGYRLGRSHNKGQL